MKVDIIVKMATLKLPGLLFSLFGLSNSKAILVAQHEHLFILHGPQIEICHCWIRFSKFQSILNVIIMIINIS